MLCENCQKNLAGLFIKTFLEEEVEEIKLCYGCAKEIGLLEGSSSKDSPSITLWMVGLKTPLQENVASRRCLNCGLSLAKFVEAHKFGCSECYIIFAEYLDDLFLRLQGTTQHVEEDLRLLKAEDTLISSQLVRLYKKLKEAVKGENYEEAAKLRDKILSLKNTARSS
ncbi:MAG TPA: UvrB/UvrC motif-containing protein [Candidatus Limnocylindrales bacterium]|nr:UvrB/UvrC motif-containing protein [Candidatus Limnocylindrales bacterium]